MCTANFFLSGNSNQKYDKLGVLLKASFSLSHGNTDLERGFSRSGLILTDHKSRMSLRTLNARQHVVAGIKKFGKPELVPITKELLLQCSRAKQNYENYLLEEKKEENRTRKKNERNFRSRKPYRNKKSKKRKPNWIYRM
jgi:hypothetical protein